MSEPVVRARGWCITINNACPEDEQALLDGDYDFLIYQHEEGDEGTPHIQAYVYKKDKLTFGAVKSYCERGHIEVARGSVQSNIDYCSKNEGRLDGPYEWGQRPSQGKRTDLQNITVMLRSGKTVEEVLLSEDCKFVRVEQYVNRIDNLLGDRRLPERPPEVNIFWGASGSGKTRRVYGTFASEQIFSAEFNAGVKWFDGYTRQPCILLDDWPLEHADDSGLYHFLLKLTDRFPLRVQIKGGWVSLNHSSIFITSNHPPASWFGGSGLRALARRITHIKHFGCQSQGTFYCTHNVSHPYNQLQNTN